MPKYQDLKAEYENLWKTIKIRPEKLSAVLEVVDTILLEKNRQRYESVQEATGVPWMVIATIHSLEASLSFKGHLHNGDPLTARTVHVPKGRPLAGSPPFNWSESAIDAIKMKQGNEVGEWSIPACLYYMEAYNGWGYRTGAGQNTTPARRSPYLWSYTTHYQKGKYTSDGHFDKNAVSKQVGAAAILLELIKALNTEPADNEHAGHASGNGERPMVMEGNRGELVAELQLLLNAKGFSVGQVDGVFGPKTKQAVLSFQTASQLEIDGRVGPQTWAALLGAGAPDKLGAGTTGIRQKVLSFAIAEASKGRAHSPGNQIDELVLDPLRPTLKKLGHLGQSQNDSFFDWCASWVTYITRHEGIAVPDIYDNYWACVAKVDAWRDMARKTGSWIRKGDAAPSPGDVVVYNWDGDADTDHIGIVKEYLPSKSKIVACEGNKNNREVITERSFGGIAGYIDIEKLAEALKNTGGGGAPKAKAATNKKKANKPK